MSQPPHEFSYVATCPDCDGWVILSAISEKDDLAEADAADARLRGYTVAKRLTKDVQADLKSCALPVCSCGQKRKAAATAERERLRSEKRESRFVPL